MKQQVQFVTPGARLHDETKFSQKQKLDMLNFWAKLELGDLCFLEIVKYGVALFGETKAGKTTLAHHLVRNPLVSKLNKDTLGYVVDDKTARLKEAAIGQGNESETQIPNECITQLVVNNQRVHLFDCPGYSDSKGSLMIVTNGYFHYRIFSKVQNLKFVLTFDGDHFKSGMTFQKATKTIIQFFNSFKDISKIKRQIFNATSFFFTKIQDQDVQQLLKNMKTANFGSKGSLINELIDEVLNKNKFYIFKRAQQVGEKPRSQQFLKKIHQNSKFWERQVNQKDKQVDMSNIQISVGSRVALLQNGEESQAARQFQLLSILYSNRFKEAFRGRAQQEQDGSNLKYILMNFLDNSFLKKQEINEFYSNNMVKFVQKYYIYDIIKQITEQNKRKYEEKRTKVKKTILSFPNPQIDKCQIPWIQKLQISKLITEFLQTYQSVSAHGFPKTISFFRQLSNKLLSIIVQIKKIKFYINDSAKKITYINTVQNFCYIIYRLIEEARTFKIIFASGGQNELILRYDVTSTVFDCTTSLIQKNSYYKTGDKDAFQKAKITFISDILEIKDNQSVLYYNSIQKYCSTVKHNNETGFLKKIDKISSTKLESVQNQGINIKIQSLISKIKNSITNLESSNSPQNFEKYTGNMNDLAFFLSNNNQQQNLNVMQIRKSLQYAKKLYKYVNNVHRVLWTYKELIKLYDQNKDEAFELKEILIQCGQYASSHGRREFSLEMFEHAYHLIDRINFKCYCQSFTQRRQQREKIAEMIGFTGLQRSYNPAEGYYDSLLRKRFCQIIQLEELNNIQKSYP